jgi:glycosyltransferase involved in cell wall biosynthesis
MRKRICHVITGLPRAGAQRVLVDLLAHRDPSLDVEVVSLLPRDAMAADVEAEGVPVWSASLDRSTRLPARLAELAAHLRRMRPSLVHTWMYHADVIGGLVAKVVAPTAPVVWHLHHGTQDFDRLRPSTRALVGIGARLSSRLPARIIACAESTRRLHVARGYDPTKMKVIRNGVDVERFHPRGDGPRTVLPSLGVPSDAPVVGLAARFHPHKDHATFLAAAQRLGARRPDVHFVLCGAGVETSNPAFAAVARSERFHLLGERDDLDRLLPELDISSLSSTVEACSLVLLESMAAGVPCVATDVGDSAHLVGDTGRVVPPRDPEALAAGWEAVLSLDDGARRALGRAARARAAREYALPAVARAIERVHDEVLNLAPEPVDGPR